MAIDIYESISPLEYRYFRSSEHKEVRKFFSEQAFIEYLARVEFALIQAYHKQGLCSLEVVLAVEKASLEIQAKEVQEEEKKTQHEMRALVHCLAAKAGKQAEPWIHLGATSHDIVCTADSLRYKEFCKQVLVPHLIALEKTLIHIALREKDTPQIGRTHGQHAIPTTFGFCIAEYVSRLGNRIVKIKEHAQQLRGKFSGAVGSYNAPSLILEDPISFEKEFLASLGLLPGDHSTQIVEPEYVLDLLHAVVSTLGVLANLADDMRHLQRSEIGEVAQATTAAQVGSSTMPHKKNPIDFENIKAIWKIFTPRILTYYMDQISEHQRDLTNSASARFIGEIFCGLYLAAKRMEKAMSKLAVDYIALKKNLHQNWDKAKSEPCYTFLALAGYPDAHELVRKAVESKVDLASFLEEKLQRKLTKKERETLEQPENYLGMASQKTEKICSFWKEKCLDCPANI